MLAFTAVRSGQVMYANPQAELYMAPFAAPSGLPGAQAIHLKANDLPKCTGLKSPGINNHWPKWSPTVGNANNKSYDWVIFSSNRYNPNSRTVTNGLALLAAVGPSVASPARHPKPRRRGPAAVLRPRRLRRTVGRTPLDSPDDRPP